MGSTCGFALSILRKIAKKVEYFFKAAANVAAIITQVQTQSKKKHRKCGAF